VTVPLFERLKKTTYAVGTGCSYFFHTFRLLPDFYPAQHPCLPSLPGKEIDGNIIF
jgi:hypothetical protein